MVARGQTIQVQDACLDLDPKPRTVGQIHRFLSCLILHKVILGIFLVRESSNPSTAALYTFYAERCHQNLLCPSELAQQAHPRNHYPSRTVLGRIFNHAKAEAVSVSGNDILGSLGVWLWPCSWITGAV